MKPRLADRLLATRAPAKINLSLHLQGRRPDGYHELESLVAFASTGDTLSLAPGRELSLVIDGPTASVIDPGHDNLVLRAARHLSERFDRLRTGEFRLTKRLPVAAGIGGGSSDAAAALRLLARRNGLAIDHPSVLEAARATGADVPVCLEARARMMGGAGERLGPRLTLPRLFAVLVNPGVALETADVFAALGLRPGERLDAGIHPQTASGLMREELLARLALMRNDLEPQALKLEPVIGEALALLKQTSGCQLARMSGSGATVFGLFGDCDASAAAAKLLRRLRRHWWVKATVLR